MYFISFSESISKDVELMLFDNNFRRIANNFYINASTKSMSDTYNFLSENYFENVKIYYGRLGDLSVCEDGNLKFLEVDNISKN
ncbi:hypothetical protein BJL57_08735 [Campylobacter jejuni]|nr:hypothetical protein [Campylobacter jejuni]